MNKLLSAASAVGMLLAVNAAQADVLTAEQMDTITAGAPFALVQATAQGFATSSGSFFLSATAAPAPGSAVASISLSGVPQGPAPNNSSVTALTSM